MKTHSVKITSSLLILMFIISGISKITSFGANESKRLSKKINIPFLKNYSQIIVFLAGIWEFISSVILLVGIWNFDKTLIHFGSLSLIIFTIMATLIFYTVPFKHLPFLSNLTTICALLLLPYICVKC